MPQLRYQLAFSQFELCCQCSEHRGLPILRQHTVDGLVAEARSCRRRLRQPNRHRRPAVALEQQVQRLPDQRLLAHPFRHRTEQRSMSLHVSGPQRMMSGVCVPES